MNTTFRSLFACAAAGALAVSLAACGPDDAQETTSSQMALADGLAPGWSMMDLAGVDPAFYEGGDGSLPQALPMAASYDGGDYGYAPMYDYAPDNGDSYYEPLDDSYYYGDDDGYDDGYYDEPYDTGYGDGGLLGLGGDGNGLALLAVATALSGVFGDAPPDYGFGYDDVSPWAWETGDRYYRYAEPVYGGYRYYYYEPDAYRPFFVSDPYYSYGYRDDRIVSVYDRGGRRIDARRARLQLQAAKAYYARAERLHRAAQHDRHGVPAPLWARQRETIARDRDDWVQKASRRPAVQQWDARHASKVQQRWAGEALVRRDAEQRFANWQRADYRTPAPKFYTPTVRQEQVRRIADLRQDHAREIADSRRDRTEKQREVRQEAQRVERAEPRAQQRGVRESIERQRVAQSSIRERQAARALTRNDRTRMEDSRFIVTARPARQTPERAAPRQQSARAAIAAQREDRKAAQAQRPASRPAIERKAEAVQAKRQATPARVERDREARATTPATRPSIIRPAVAAERPAREARADRQQQLQQRQKAQKEASAERSRQAAVRQQERVARQAQARPEPPRATVERRRERVSRQSQADPARQAIAQRREEQAQQPQQAQAEQRQQARAEQRQRAQAQPAQRQRVQAEQRQAPAEQPQQARTEQRKQERQERQNAREEQREARASRRGDRG